MKKFFYVFYIFLMVITDSCTKEIFLLTEENPVSQDQASEIEKAEEKEIDDDDPIEEDELENPDIQGIGPDKDEPVGNNESNDSYDDEQDAEYDTGSGFHFSPHDWTHNPEMHIDF